MEGGREEKKEEEKREKGGEREGRKDRIARIACWSNCIPFILVFTFQKPLS